MIKRSSSPNYPISGLLILFCLFHSINSTAAEESAISRSTVASRLAIADQLAQYSYRWDGKDASAFAELFTTDAVMERWRDGRLVEGSRISGRPAILEYARQSHQGRLADRQTRHHFSGLVFLELSANLAVTENMALITHQTAADRVARISSSGIYRNSWVKTPAGWLISKRILLTDSFTGPAQ